jgi:cell division protein FtsL
MKKNNQKRYSKLSLLVILTVITLSLVQIVISHHLSTSGEKIRQMEDRIALLEQENRTLNGEIGSVGSLSSISAKASELGLVRTSQIQHFAEQIPVALRP